MDWKCYFDEINKNKMIIVGLNEEKGLIEIRFMEMEGEEENGEEKKKMRLNKKVEIELKNYEFNHENIDFISHLMTPKDNYLILYQGGENRSKWLYYIDTATGETLGKTEIDGKLLSGVMMFCVYQNQMILFAVQMSLNQFIMLNLMQIYNKN